MLAKPDHDLKNETVVIPAREAYLRHAVHHELLNRRGLLLEVSADHTIAKRVSGLYTLHSYEHWYVKIGTQDGCPTVLWRDGKRQRWFVGPKLNDKTKFAKEPSEAEWPLKFCAPYHGKLQIFDPEVKAYCEQPFSAWPFSKEVPIIPRMISVTVQVVSDALIALAAEFFRIEAVRVDAQQRLKRLQALAQCVAECEALPKCSLSRQALEASVRLSLSQIKQGMSLQDVKPPKDKLLVEAGRGRLPNVDHYLTEHFSEPHLAAVSAFHNRRASVERRIQRQIADELASLAIASEALDELLCRVSAAVERR